MRASTTTLIRAARPLLQTSSATRTPFLASRGVHFQTAFSKSAVRVARRFQSTEAAPAVEAAQKSWLRSMWDSPIGFKTVHFWAPVMKWALVLAGIADFARPAQSLSLTQNAALTATGAIWTRWCFVIKPRNVLLAAVNFFLGVVGIIQVTRILMWRNSPEGKATLAAEQAKEGAKSTVESVKETAVEGVKAVTQ